jgi:hypothetical protein
VSPLTLAKQQNAVRIVKPTKESRCTSWNIT